MPCLDPRMAAATDAPRILVVNPSAQESWDGIGTALRLYGAAVNHVSTYAAVAMLMGAAPDQMVNIAEHLPADGTNYDGLIVLGGPFSVRSEPDGGLMAPPELVVETERLIRTFHECAPADPHISPVVTSCVAGSRPVSVGPRAGPTNPFLACVSGHSSSLALSAGVFSRPRRTLLTPPHRFRSRQWLITGSNSDTCGKILLLLRGLTLSLGQLWLRAMHRTSSSGMRIRSRFLQVPRRSRHGQPFPRNPFGSANRLTVSNATSRWVPA
jgi:hypothetical protein